MQKSRKKFFWQFLLDKVITTCVEKLPAHISCLVIQQDNAPCHYSEEEFCHRWRLCKEATLKGRLLEVRLICQPPSSPDTNVLDLGVFSSLQSRQLKHFSSNFCELIDLVQQAYDEMEVATLRKIFFTLAATKNKIIECRGDNAYELPRSGLKKSSNIPELIPASLACIEVTEWVIERLEEQLDQEKAQAEARKQQFTKNISMMGTWMTAVRRRDTTERNLNKMIDKLEQLQEAQMERAAEMDMNDNTTTDDNRASI